MCPGNLKDFRRLDGVNKLIEMLAALPDTDRTPNDKVSPLWGTRGGSFRFYQMGGTFVRDIVL